MREQQLTELLELAAERTSIGPPPLDEMLAHSALMRRRRTFLAITAAAAAVVAIIGGSAAISGLGSNPQREAAPPEVTASTGPAERSAVDVSLDGTWTVQALIGTGGNSVLPATYKDRLHVTFSNGEMTGTTGCNNIAGSYGQSGDRGQDLTFSRALGTTLVGCRDEPPLGSRLLDVRHVSGSGDVRYLHAASWMIIAELHRVAPALPDPTDATPRSQGDVSAREYALAEDRVRDEVGKDEASFTSATVTVGAGTVTDTNTGYSCTSGRLLHLKLIGTFPHIVTSGLAGSPGDTTVRAVLLTADARSGRVCLEGVQTGVVTPEPGSLSLPLD